MRRRDFIKGVFATSAMVVSTNLMAEEANKAEEAPEVSGLNDLNYDAAIQAITDGKEVKKSDKIKLTVPEIAENGAVVPVKVQVESPMSEEEYVKVIHVLNTKNGNTRCADVMLTPMNAKGYFSTRIKLSETQDVVALVELSDGTFLNAAKSVKVTIGGCG